MNQEQSAIVRRLAIIGAILLVVVAVVYFVYAPKDAAPEGANSATGHKKAFAAVFRSGLWDIDSNGTGRWEGAAGGDTELQLGKAGDIPITGTWDAAEGPSVGVFRDGVFTLLINKRPETFSFGAPGDVPVVGDWNGDGRSKIGIYRKGFWMLDLNGNHRYDGPSLDRMVALGGNPGDVPIVGDWNGDGKTDVGVFTAKAVFALDANGNGVWDKEDKMFTLGASGDIPIAGDWNANGRSKIGVFHNGFWSLDYDGDLAWVWPAKDKFIALGGVAGDVPVLGDWNGDGRTKVGVYRAGMWLLDSDGSGVFDKFDKTWQFGLPGDVPVVMAPLPTKK